MSQGWLVFEIKVSAFAGTTGVGSLGDALTPGPSQYSERIIFHHTFDLATPSTKKGSKRNKKSEPGRKPKPQKAIEPTVPRPDKVKRPKRTHEEKKEYQRLYAAEERRRRKEAGLCKDCGKTSSIQGQVRCETCRDKHRQSLRRSSATALTKRTKPTTERTSRVIELKNPARQAYRKDRNARGLCRDCPADALEGKSRCQTCVDKCKVYRRRRSEKNAGTAPH